MDINLTLKHFYSLTSEVSSFINNRFLSPLTSQQKKIVAIVASLLTLFVVYGVVKCCFKGISLKKKNGGISLDKILNKSNKGNDLTKEGKIALMLKEDYTSENALRISLEEKVEMARVGGNEVTDLNFAGSNLTDKQLQEVLKSCPNLKSLNLSKCKKLTDAGIVNLPPRLESLHLSGCINITAIGIKGLPEKLNWLDLSHCNKLTDEAVEFIPKKVHYLDLSFCNRLTDAFFDHFPKNLKALNLTGCSKIKKGTYKNGMTYVS